ncbi:accessory Sec system S-layer assembly protein [Bacillus sp. S/N-304-OC-R1]|uniref:accessory Sec system S-layer assembly protein n=1 Tax=Bacillus sp. S/N-304-OC-R1 TaxID=2758034 RepID=UPI001C8D96C2|nr:accessory Sec system S-layer assembly protein [Bacillus sp. S/N-304-OC-R1]MBY0123504.1 accessory Sec system S-layer assembly protein [Bacillus sp. S/N-304-OC-R1]
MGNKKKANASNADGIKTKLSYHPDWDLTVQEKYVFQYNHQKLPRLQPNQLSVSGINLYEYDDGFVVTAFLNSSLPQAISFEVIDLVLVNENNEPLARKGFEMDLFGELPPNTSRPWRFLFENENKLVEEIPKKGWKLVFELKKKQVNGLVLDLEDSWEASLSDEQKAKLEEINKNLPALREGEVNFMGLEANIVEGKGIAVTLLIRNASNRSIFIENIPLAFEDASQEVVAQAGFQLNNLEVKSQTCKPWTFVFPESAITKENLDLSRWKAYVPQSAKVDVKQS